MSDHLTRLGGPEEEHYTRDDWIADEIFAAVYNPGHGIDLRNATWQVKAEAIRDHLKAEELLTDEHHSTQELYDYRMAYNALIFNEWAAQDKYDVHKSWRHSDGEECFGGGWFIVCAITPHGLVSNHYAAEHWGMFNVPERDIPVEYDGHTPQEVLQRLISTASESETTK